MWRRARRRCRSRASRTRASRASRRSAFTCTRPCASSSSTRSCHSWKGSWSAIRATRRPTCRRSSPPATATACSRGSTKRSRAAPRSSAGGGEILAGGKVREDGVLAPTVLGGVTPDMKVCADEVFGPVVGVATYTDLDDALRLANDSRYGLQAAIFTADLADALTAARTLDYGGVLVN